MQHTDTIRDSKKPGRVSRRTDGDELPEPVDITITGTPVFRSSHVNKLSSHQIRLFQRRYGNGYALIRDALLDHEPDAVDRLTRTGQRDKSDQAKSWTPARHGKYFTSNPAEGPSRQESDRVPDRLVLILETSDTPDANAEEGEWPKQEAQGLRTSRQGRTRKAKPTTKAAKGSVTSY